jgi:hypothetical protein
MTRATAVILARVAAVALLAIGVGVLIWALFIRPGELKADVAVAKAGAIVATGRQAAAEDQTRIVERYHDRTTEIRTIQTEGVAAVAAALDDAAGGAAARRAICLLDPARQLSDPACELFEAGAEKRKGPDAGLAAAKR